MDASDRKVAGKLHLFQNAFLARGDMHFGLYADAAGHDYGLGLDGEFEEILNASIRYVHVEIDDVSLTPHVDYRTISCEAGVSQPGVNGLQVSVSTRAVHDGVKFGVQGQLVIAGVE